MARPTKRTPEVQSAILNALRVGNTRTDSALAAEVSLGSLSEWCRRYPEFLAAVEKAEAEARLRFVAIIAVAARTSWQAAAWWLERRRHEDYGRRDKVDMQIDVGHEAQRIAEAEGLDPDSVMAEASRILTGR
jgi:hypothetical protein